MEVTCSSNGCCGHRKSAKLHLNQAGSHTSVARPPKEGCAVFGVAAKPWQRWLDAVPSPAACSSASSFEASRWSCNTAPTSGRCATASWFASRLVLVLLGARWGAQVGMARRLERLEGESRHLEAQQARSDCLHWQPGMPESSRNHPSTEGAPWLAAGSASAARAESHSCAELHVPGFRDWTEAGCQALQAKERVRSTAKVAQQLCYTHCVPLETNTSREAAGEPQRPRSGVAMDATAKAISQQPVEQLQVALAMAIHTGQMEASVSVSTGEAPRMARRSRTPSAWQLLWADPSYVGARACILGMCKTVHRATGHGMLDRGGAIFKGEAATLVAEPTMLNVPCRMHGHLLDVASSTSSSKDAVLSDVAARLLLAEDKPMIAEMCTDHVAQSGRCLPIRSDTQGQTGTKWHLQWWSGVLAGHAKMEVPRQQMAGAVVTNSAGLALTPQKGTLPRNATSEASEDTAVLPLHGLRATPQLRRIGTLRPRRTLPSTEARGACAVTRRRCGGDWRLRWTAYPHAGGAELNLPKPAVAGLGAGSAHSVGARWRLVWAGEDSPEAHHPGQ
mmetsp:Transcript_56744/g.182238  ORF Transcript_56744/g.182238 Transcript_56744/m.182238 type:complete len:563 (-) Transcript_56744:185-1873(-)